MGFNMITSRPNFLAYLTVIAAPPHTHTYTATVTAPTCTAQGYTTHTCTCDESYVDTYVDALGHAWDGGVVTTRPTYTSEGVRTFTCTRCGETRTEAIDRLTYDPRDPDDSGSSSRSSTPSTPDTPSVTVPDDPTPLDPGTDINDQDVPLASIPIPFVDVQAGVWHRDAVAFVFSKGIMGGTSDTTFAPEGKLNRGMLVTMLHRMEGTPTSPLSAFTDVRADQYWAEAIGWASRNGVVLGYSSTEFAPGRDITREQLAVILYRYAQLKGYDVSARSDLSGYTDQGSIGAYALEAMQWAVAEELIGGKTSTTLIPGGEATRAEAAVILLRFCQNVTHTA